MGLHGLLQGQLYFYFNNIRKNKLFAAPNYVILSFPLLISAFLNNLFPRNLSLSYKCLMRATDHIYK
jgi:hypothetical protein